MKTLVAAAAAIALLAGCMPVAGTTTKTTVTIDPETGMPIVTRETTTAPAAAEPTPPATPPPAG